MSRWLTPRATTDPEEEVKEEEVTGEERQMRSRRPGLEVVKSEQVEQKEEEERGQVKSEQEVREEEEQKRAEEVREERSGCRKEAREKEVKAQEERGREEGQVDAQGWQKEEEEELMDAQGGRERREEEKRNENSLHKETHVSNRHMTWWQNAWWVRVNNGPHMRTARGRRGIWRAARQAAEQACHEESVGETQVEEGERDRQGRKRQAEMGRKTGQTGQ